MVVRSLQNLSMLEYQTHSLERAPSGPHGDSLGPTRIRALPLSQPRGRSGSGLSWQRARTGRRFQVLPNTRPTAARMFEESERQGLFIATFEVCASDLVQGQLLQRSNSLPLFLAKGEHDIQVTGYKRLQQRLSQINCHLEFDKRIPGAEPLNGKWQDIVREILNKAHACLAGRR
jgi:hypothetical protein